jgi:IS5 family transposase
VHNIINWGEIEQTLSNLYTSKTPASAYPPIMMFKILILQAWYALSDEALEKQIARDLMFRRLVSYCFSRFNQHY